jgi:hypothetical protein
MVVNAKHAKYPGRECRGGKSANERTQEPPDVYPVIRTSYSKLRREENTKVPPRREQVIWPWAQSYFHFYIFSIVWISVSRNMADMTVGRSPLSTAL